MRMHISKIPPEIIDEYNLLPKVCDGYVCFCIKKAIYGLKQSGALAAKMLAKILNKRGYYQATHTKGLWLHKTKNILFTLVIDNFRLKYICRENAEELISLLEETYPQMQLVRQTVHRSTPQIGLQLSKIKNFNARLRKKSINAISTC